ncbi:hypothetical protein BJI67_16210 (plasmid) [Acidihalobacter aeolianus]|uniref:LysM domain-containing protein n=2 Tax=Acidihalobacter aeolianus TaxID=2792603 RepID=A0A1D8KCW7_9GAMM|nr:hypothetical protein BJI67_16210 [Acidihalobacter aeolianus]
MAHLPPLPQANCTTFYYRVLNGDSLSLIAKHVLRNAKDWRIIYTANKSLIGDNPSDIMVGQVLKVPVAAN